MDSFDLIQMLEKYQPEGKEEHCSVEMTKQFLKNSDNCYSRTNKKGHITAGALLMSDDGDVLINHHKILDLWLLFGGHSDGNSNSLEVAKREVKEESGLEIIDDSNGRVLDVATHIIPENKQKNEPEHIHYDIRFLFFVEKNEANLSNESKEARWVSIEEAKVLMKDSDKIRLLNKAQKIYLSKNHK